MKRMILALALTFPFASFAKSPPEVLFVGSSTIQFWNSLGTDFPDVQPINLGVWGTKFPFLIEHANEWASKFPNADAVVIYDGDNDIAEGSTPEQVVASFRNAAELLHAHELKARIFVLSIKPCLASDRRDKIALVKQANRLIQKTAKELGYVTYVDNYGDMIDARGEPKPELFRADGLHLSPAGYALWVKNLKPLLSALGPHALMSGAFKIPGPSGK
jgi:hypothetical protein